MGLFVLHFLDFELDGLLGFGKSFEAQVEELTR